MANVNNPCGFKPLNNVCLRRTPYRIEGSEGTPYATALYIGDPVVLSSGYIVKATAGTDNQSIGVIVGFECINGGLKGGGYYPASSGYDWYAIVADDPAQRFVGQDDGVGTALAIAYLGNTGNFIFTHSGSEYTNLSGAELDGSSFSSGNAVTDQVRLLGLVDKPGNAWGANGEYIFEIHNHQLRQENNVDATT